MPLPDVPDTFRLTVHMTGMGQEFINVFYYRDTAILGPTPVAVAQGFWDNVKAAWRAFWPNSSNFTFDRVDCEQLSDTHPFGSYAITGAEVFGTRTVSGDMAPPTLAGLIRLNVGTRVTRPGSKRIAGLQEGDVNYSTLASGTVTLLQTLATAFADPFNATGGTIEMTPVIVGYPGPQNPGDPRVQDVISGTASSYVSHQVSRDPRP